VLDETDDVFNDITLNQKLVKKSVPTVSLVSLPGTTLSNTSLVALRFTVSADAAGDVALKKLSFESSVSLAGAGTTVAIDGLRRVGDGSNLGADSYIDGNVTADACNGNDATCIGQILLDNEEVIAAGTSRTYDLRLTIGGTAVSSGDTISTKLLGDSALATGELDALGGTQADAEDIGIDNIVNGADAIYYFLWSDVSAVPHNDTVDDANGDDNGATASNDWTNGYLVKVLPTDTQSLTK
jgi:hypothetical protein